MLTKNKCLFGSLFFALAFLFIGIAYATCVFYNYTSSVPIGYYWKSSISSIQKNRLYFICINAKYSNILKQLGIKQNHSHCANGIVPLIKRVVAQKGDIVFVGSDGIYVNNHKIANSRSYSMYKNINLYPVKIGYKLKLAQNQFWVMGETADSFDSRYFGLLNFDDFIGKATPLWIIR